MVHSAHLFSPVPLLLMKGTSNGLTLTTVWCHLPELVHQFLDSVSYQDLVSINALRERWASPPSSRLPRLLKWKRDARWLSRVAGLSWAAPLFYGSRRCSYESLQNVVSMIDNQRDMSFTWIVCCFALNELLGHSSRRCNRSFLVEFTMPEEDRRELDLFQSKSPWSPE